MDNMKNLHELVRILNIVDDNALVDTDVVCTEFVTKLTDYFIIFINKLPYSIHNVVNSIELNKR